MKGKNLIITSLVMLLAGVGLAYGADTLTSDRIVLVCGILFIVAGVANIFYFLGARTRTGESRAGAMGTVVAWIASAAAIVLGVAMLVFAATFVALVAFMFAILIAATAIFQICLLIFGTRPVRLTPWFYIVPMLLFGAAVYTYLQRPGDEGADNRILWATGIAFALFGLVGLIEAAAIGAAKRALNKGGKDVEEDVEKEHGNKEPGTGNKEPETGNKEPETGNKEPETGNKEPETGNKEPETGNRESEN